MRRFGSVAVTVALCVAVTACGEDALNDLGLSAEDREKIQELEDLVQEAAEAAQEAQNGGGDGGEGTGDDGADEPQERVDPDWSPAGIPPPPGDPSASADQSDSSNCPVGRRCGWAAYDGDDGSAATEHYEDVFGRPADETVRRPSVNNEGQTYDAVTSTWDDGDVEVMVYNDHNGTDVVVEADR